MFVIPKNALYRGSIPYILPVSLAGTTNIVRYIEEFVKSRFHCTRAVARYFGPGIQ